MHLMALLTPPTHPLIQLWIRCRIHTVILGTSSYRELLQNLTNDAETYNRKLCSLMVGFALLLHIKPKIIMQQNSDFMHSFTHTQSIKYMPL